MCPVPRDTPTIRPSPPDPPTPKDGVPVADQSINPYDGNTLASFEHLTSAQLDNALAAAERCFQTLKPKPYAERAVILNKAATSARPVRGPSGAAWCS